jgi:multidrug transporter EmrE-like cation transporter
VIKMWNGKVEIHNPVRWWITNVLGVVGPLYALAGRPFGDLPDGIEYALWGALGVVLVRVVGFIMLVHLYRTEER